MPDSDGLYQGGRLIGSVAEFSYDQKSYTITFNSVTFTEHPDFSVRMFFRDAVLHCSESYPAEETFSPNPSELYFGLHCKVTPPGAQLD
jgi:hypothetical protein